MTPDILLAHLGDVTGSSRALRQLRALAGAGWQVAVLALPPREPAALPPGVTLHPLRLRAGSGPRWFWEAHRSVARSVRGLPARLYVASDLYVLPALAAAARRHGARLAYDSRELYAALDSAAGRPHVAALWSAVERRWIGRADAVWTVGDAIADRLAAGYGIARPIVLYNAPEHGRPARTDALARRLGLPDDGRALVVYSGLFREGRGLPALLRATGAVDAVRTVLIGEGVLADALRAQAAALGGRAHVLPFVAPDALPPLVASADIGACLIEPRTESLRLSLPNKLFEYLSAGLPVLASTVPEARRVVEASGAGLVADPADPAALAAALAALADPAVRARCAARTASALEPYAWTHGADRLLRSVRSLLAPR